MSLTINDLIPTHNSLRSAEQVLSMMEHVRNGGVFDHQKLAMFIEETGKGINQLIQIARFEDGKLFIRDGHHRILAIYLADRHLLDPSEYELNDWKYSQYLEVNLDVGWVTPFNPRTEIRFYDLTNWKAAVKEMMKSVSADQPDQIEQLIRSNKKRFALPRGDVWHIRHLKSILDAIPEAS